MSHHVTAMLHASSLSLKGKRKRKRNIKFRKIDKRKRNIKFSKRKRKMLVAKAFHNSWYI